MDKTLLARLAKLLLEKSYLQGEVTLTSGRKSDYYFDCKQAALHPEGSYLLGKLIFSILRPEVTGVGGMTLGADPLVSSVVLTSYLEKRPLPGFIVRKKAKGHGTQNYLEGLENFSSGQKIAVLEDVVTTGGSLLTACERITRAGLEITQVICILDREEGGRSALKEQGHVLESIFTRQSLLQWAQ